MAPKAGGEVDVIVVGFGGAGACAAIEAARVAAGICSNQYVRGLSLVDCVHAERARALRPLQTAS